MVVVILAALVGALVASASADDSARGQAEMVPLIFFGPPASVGRVHISPAGEPYRNRGNVLETATGIWCTGHACIRQFPTGTVVTLRGEAKRKIARLVFDTAIRSCKGQSVCKFRLTKPTAMKSWFCPKSWSRSKCISSLPGIGGKG
jgi:hypothetical protein